MTRARSIAVLVPLLMLGGGLLAAVNATIPKKRPEDDIKGKELWERSCWHCHGKGNAGDGPAAADLPVGVPNLQGEIREDRFEALTDTIMQGKGAMPAFEVELDRHNARRILVYLNKLDREESWPKTKRGGAAEDEAADDSGAEEKQAGDEEASEAKTKELDPEGAPPIAPIKAKLQPPKKLLKVADPEGAAE